jgi:hypothetical protein
MPTRGLKGLKMKVLALFISWCVLVILCWGAVLAVAILISIAAAFVRNVRCIRQLTFMGRA